MKEGDEKPFRLKSFETDRPTQSHGVREPQNNSDLNLHFAPEAAQNIQLKKENANFLDSSAFYRLKIQNNNFADVT
jgi:hypothetical protein